MPCGSNKIDNSLKQFGYDVTNPETDAHEKLNKVRQRIK